MPLLGPAAMLLGFDIVEAQIADHDRWHTHEHLPERLSIPGFLRGTRWLRSGDDGGALQAAASAGRPPRYAVLYEVQSLATLTSDAYLARLNQPTPWTARVMPHYRGMTRGLCRVRASHGHGTGHEALLLRWRPPAPGASAASAATMTTTATTLDRWLADELLPALPARAGLVGAHWLEGAAAAPMTNEQRLRGADAGVAGALLVTGYDAAALDELAGGDLSAARLHALGATEVTAGRYRLGVTLTAQEMAIPAAGPERNPRDPVGPR